MNLRFLPLAFFSLVFPVSVHAETETLEQAWAQVYQNNPSLLAARAELRSLDEHVSQALSHWRPSVDVTSNVGKTYQYIPDQAVYGTARYANVTGAASVQVTQPLFRGFRTQAETESAENEVKAARAKLSDIEQQTFLDTATAYLDILRDEDVLEAARDNEQVLREKLKETEERAKVGELTQTDTHQAESRLARAQVATLQNENALVKSRAAYLRLVGHAPTHLQPPQIAADKSVKHDEILHRAETKNPNVLSASYAIDEAKARVDLSKGALLPELNLVGNSGSTWGQNSTIPGREDSSQIMLQLTVPLYRAGTDYSRAREAEQTVAQRRMELRESQYKAHESAENACQALETAEAALGADDAEVNAASLALLGVKEEAKAGTRTTLDVLNAEQELLDAKIERAKSIHDRDLAVLQIRAAIGALTAAALQLRVKTYDPQRYEDQARGQWIGFSQNDTPSPALTTTP